jgi:hypothetical protein
VVVVVATLVVVAVITDGNIIKKSYKPSRSHRGGFFIFTATFVFLIPCT